METLRKVDLFQYCTYRELMAVWRSRSSGSSPRGAAVQRGRHRAGVLRGGLGRGRHREGRLALATMGPGDYFGEMSLLDDLRRSADAVAVAETVVLVLLKSRFLQLMKQDSDLAAKLMWQLLNKLAHRAPDNDSWWPRRSRWIVLSSSRRRWRGLRARAPGLLRGPRRSGRRGTPEERDAGLAAVG